MMLRLTHGLKCSLCARLRDSQRVADSLTGAAIFGAKAYALCPCCKQEWLSPDSPSWRRKVDTWLLRNRVMNAMRQTYYAVAGDVWGEKTPSKVEYVDVVLDLLEVHGGLSKADIAAVRNMSFHMRRTLCLKVGP